MTDPIVERNASEFGPEFGPPVPPNFRVEPVAEAKDAFPDPYDREIVIAQEFEVPSPLDLADYDPIGSFYNEQVGRSFSVLCFEEHGELPRPIAEWLHYWTFTDDLLQAQTEGDTARFGDVDQIQQLFLKDQKGRRPYFAVDETTGELRAASWLHPLLGTGSGSSMVRACNVFNAKQEEDSKLRINTATAATLASRVFGEEYRGKGIHGQLLVQALEDYKKHKPTCEGIVIRVAKVSGRAIGAFESKTLTDLNAGFTPISDQGGAIYMVNRGLISSDPEDYDPRPHREFE